MNNLKFICTYTCPKDLFSCDIYVREKDVNDTTENNILACEVGTKNSLFGGSYFASVESAKHAVDLVAKPPVDMPASPNVANALEIWNELESITVNDDGEIESTFLHFQAGTHRYDIWRWIETKFDISIGTDLLGL